MNPDLSTPQVLEALTRGNVREAIELTGSPYTLHGRVVHGNHLGRTLGFPTANLELPPNRPFIPARGVYAVKVKTEGVVYGGMANAGIRPTIDGHVLTVEVNLFDFSGDLYDKTLEVCFIDRIRDEKKFSTLEELARQIAQDKLEAVRLLA